MSPSTHSPKTSANEKRQGVQSLLIRSIYLNISQLSLPYAKSSITEPGINPCGDHDLDREVGESPRWCLSSGSVIRQGYREVGQQDKLFYSKIKVKLTQFTFLFESLTLFLLQVYLPPTGNFVSSSYPSCRRPKAGCTLDRSPVKFILSNDIF